VKKFFVNLQQSQKTMKSVIAFVFLIVIWAGATGVEYDLAIHLGFLLSAFASFLTFVVVMGGLFRAPEGYEDENGFHTGAPAGVAQR
jgi:hypothetical protein